MTTIVFIAWCTLCATSFIAGVALTKWLMSEPERDRLAHQRYRGQASPVIDPINEDAMKARARGGKSL